MPDNAADAVKDARGTARRGNDSRRGSDPGPPALPAADIARLQAYVVDHATMRPAHFEAKYRRSWLSAAPTVQEAARVLALHQRLEERRWERIESVRTTMDVNRERQAAQDFAAFNRGVDALKSGGVIGTALGVTGVAVAANRGASIEELANVAGTLVGAGNVAGLLLSSGMRVTPSTPPPAAVAAPPPPMSRGNADRGTAPAQRSVPPQPVVIDPATTPAGNDNSRPWGTPRRIPAAQPTPQAEELPATGTFGPARPRRDAPRAGPDSSRGGRPSSPLPPPPPSGGSPSSPRRSPTTTATPLPYVNANPKQRPGGDEFVLGEFLDREAQAGRLSGIGRVRGAAEVRGQQSADYRMRKSDGTEVSADAVHPQTGNPASIYDRIVSKAGQVGSGGIVVVELKHGRSTSVSDAQARETARDAVATAVKIDRVIFVRNGRIVADVSK